MIKCLLEFNINKGASNLKKVNFLSKHNLVICLVIFFFIFSQSFNVLAKTDDKSKTIKTSKKSITMERNNANDINKGISGLNYDKNEILSSKGDEIKSFVPKEGKKLKDKFIVVERIKRSVQTSPVDISIIDSMANRAYPGALQIADSDFINNQPNLLVCKRNPLKISIDLPGLGRDNKARVKNPTYGNVSGAIDDLINTWSEKYSSTHTLPARTQYSESMVYSKSQLKTSLNINPKITNNLLDIDFNAVQNGDKKIMIAAYKQIFYTVSAELPYNPSDLFYSSVTFDELTRKGISNSTPPLMVSNVAYGRTIYVKLETSSKSKNVQAAFKALLNNNGAETKEEYKDILNQSSFTALVLGGDASEHNKIITKNFDEIREVIKSNAQFSIKNPAYPISYTSVFLKDNSVAAVHNKTEYIETRATEYSKGKISIDHCGAYVAQFEVAWDEFSYDKNGNEVLVHRTWDGNWKDRTAHYSAVIPLKPNSKNIRILARECTGLQWEWWRTIINEYNVPLNSDIRVSVGGTTLYPTSSIDY
ncbi:thiol-activated cytolysin family protein [Clostridium oceanicum]|uniref:thiol-activated cytolysin family protein n=1 Tax=Clostridium oceanicum TaxID=1543 RepID=UPI003CD0A988